MVIWLVALITKDTRFELCGDFARRLGAAAGAKGDCLREHCAIKSTAGCIAGTVIIGVSGDQISVWCGRFDNGTWGNGAECRSRRPVSGQSVARCKVSLGNHDNIITGEEIVEPIETFIPETERPRRCGVSGNDSASWVARAIGMVKFNHNAILAIFPTIHETVIV